MTARLSRPSVTSVLSRFALPLPSLFFFCSHCRKPLSASNNRFIWERAQDGSRVVNPGSFSRTFETFLDQRIEKARQSERQGSQTDPADAKKEYEERALLGRAMVAEDKIERLTL